MSNVAVQQHHRSSWPEMSDIFPGLPSWANLRPIFGGHPIKVEDDIRDGKYELKAEIPGVDPDKDVDITVRNGMLTIKAERSEKKETNGHSEFSYGSFTRTVALPTGADEDHIKAHCEKGVLTVSVPLKEPKSPEKHIAVERAG